MNGGDKEESLVRNITKALGVSIKLDSVDITKLLSEIKKTDFHPESLEAGVFATYLIFFDDLVPGGHAIEYDKRSLAKAFTHMTFGLLVRTNYQLPAVISETVLNIKNKGMLSEHTAAIVITQSGRPIYMEHIADVLNNISK